MAFALYHRLAALAHSTGATYTRYADDLTFSGDRAIEAALMNRVPQIIRDTRFTPNPAKTRVT